MVLTLYDRLLAAIGAIAATALRLVGGSRTALRVLIVALLIVSAIPTFIIGSSKRPSDLSFDDVRYQRIPAMTSWFRVEGDLRSADNPVQPLLYELVDPKDGSTYIDVLAPSPLPLGHTTVTGSLSATGPVAGGYIGWMDADAVAEPRQDDRFWLILLPGIVGLLILLGLHLGYPVLRPERARRAPGSDGIVRPAPSDGVPAAWAGWIRSESAPMSDPRPCVVTVTPGPDVAQLTVSDGGVDRPIPVRRGGAARRVRLWYLRRSQPALDVRGAGGDIILVFDDPVVRDRVGAAFG